MDGLKDVIESKILPFISGVSPLVASVLVSPAAGMAIALLTHAFGVTNADIDGLATAISCDPDSKIKIQEIEASHREALAKLASTNYSTEMDDRKNARQYGGLYKDFLRHMAYLVTFGFFGALFLLFVPFNLGGDEKNLLSMLVGMLASKWQTIIDFFFGSSRHNQGAIK